MACEYCTPGDTTCPICRPAPLPPALDAGAAAPQDSQAPANEPPFVDTPLKQAMRLAFDHPTYANIQHVAEVAARPLVEPPQEQGPRIVMIRIDTNELPENPFDVLANPPQLPLLTPAPPREAQQEIVHRILHEFTGKPCRADGGWCDARDHAEAIMAALSAPEAGPQS